MRAPATRKVWSPSSSVVVDKIILHYRNSHIPYLTASRTLVQLSLGFCHKEVCSDFSVIKCWFLQRVKLVKN